jgi:hypothetical protein
MLLDLHRQQGFITREDMVRSGLQPGAVAAELRRRGYEVKLAEDRAVIIVKMQGEAAVERAANQTSLFDLPGTTHVPRHGWGDDPE